MNINLKNIKSPEQARDAVAALMYAINTLPEDTGDLIGVRFNDEYWGIKINKQSYSVYPQ